MNNYSSNLVGLVKAAGVGLLARGLGKLTSALRNGRNASDIIPGSNQVDELLSAGDSKIKNLLNSGDSKIKNLLKGQQEVTPILDDTRIENLLKGSDNRIEALLRRQK